MAESITIGVLQAILRMDAKQFHAMLNTTEKKLKHTSEQMERVGRSLTMRVTAPLLALSGAAAKMSISMESAFAGVRKTVEATEEEFAVLRKGFEDMSLVAPIAVEGIMEIGEAAGQLGIQTKNIIGFTDTMAKLGVTTNMTAQGAAMSLARLANITKMPQTEFDKLGSTIVDLGNNLATTEGEIVSMGLRIAAAGKMAGLAESEILAISGALSSVGVEAQVGGTSIQKVLINMTKAVAQGNDQLQTFADVAGKTVSDFATLFREDAAEAFTQFIEGLEKEGEAGFQVLENLELADQRVIRSILSIANAGGLLRNSLQLGRKAWRENNALTEEARKRFETAASQLKIFWNEVRLTAASFGDALIPRLLEVTDKLKEYARILRSVEKDKKQSIIQWGLFAAAIGPATWAISKLLKSLVWLKAAWTSPVGLAIGVFTGVTAAVAGLSSAIIAATDDSRDFQEVWDGYWDEYKKGIWEAITGFKNLAIVMGRRMPLGGSFGGSLGQPGSMGMPSVGKLNKDEIAAGSEIGRKQRALEREVESLITVTALREEHNTLTRDYINSLNDAETAAGHLAKREVELSEEQKNAELTINEMLRALEFEHSLLGKISEERERSISLAQFESELKIRFNEETLKLAENQAEYNRLMEEYEGWLQKIADGQRSFSAFSIQMNQWAMDATNIWANLGEIAVNSLDRVADALSNALSGVKVEWNEVLAAMLMDFNRMIIKMQMAKILKSVIPSLFGEGQAAALIAAGTQVSTAITAAATTVAATISTSLGTVGTTISAAIVSAGVTAAAAITAASIGGAVTDSALGNVFSMGKQITAFAKGGIVGQATLAPMALMGEKGPEAIMPLTRGPSGELGVKAIQPNVMVEPKFRFINILDKREMANVIGTEEGETEVLNILRRNRII